ncbi:hypothetical protein BGX26_011942 [Mortierella sp. AD094]|nr:hypothetical protein BGX26_011942 [Mortierella sp. AD094]
MRKPNQPTSQSAMEDVHMETPPMSSTSYLESPSAVQETGNTGEDPSRLSAIRASLGQSTVRDFGIYRDILEEHHERRERIIKVSRDINNFSKKMIFALHRAEPKDYLPQFSALSEALMEFKEKHATVLKLFHRAAIDLQGSNYYRYQRSISGAMQEYIEAMTLEYYLVHGKLMPKSALETDLVFMTSPEQFSDPDLIIGIGQTQSGGGGGGGGGGGSRGKFNKDNRKTPYSKDKREGGRKPGNTATTDATPVDSLISANNTTTPMVIEDIHASTATTSTAAQAGVQEVKLTKLTLEVTDEDYLLGIADLTGELMRLAINTLGQSLVVSTKDLELEGGLQLPSPEERVQQILSFLRNIKSGFDGLSLTRSSPISKKMGVLKQSLNKIEMACYNVKVRGAEYPPDILRQMLMSGQDVGGGSNGGTGGEAGDDDEE